MPRTLPDRSAELLADLHAVYRDADQLYAGWTCPASTECCRFGMTGREPYVTSIELAAIEKAMRAAAGAGRGSAPRPRPRIRAGASTGRVTLPIVRDERTCPLLDGAGRCAVYDARPLGCRTFYCDRADPGGKVKQPAINALVRRIQDIAARHAPDGDKGRPLTRALQSAR